MEDKGPDSGPRYLLSALSPQKSGIRPEIPIAWKLFGQPRMLTACLLAAPETGLPVTQVRKAGDSRLPFSTL